jgi:CheY-like chemotaxis protein
MLRDTRPEKSLPVAASRPAQRILVVDDEPLIGRLMAMTLERDELEVFQQPKLALARLSEASFDIVICDLMMPEMTGIEFHRQLSQCDPGLARRFVLMTGSGPRGDVEAFLREHQAQLLQKPFAVADIERCLTHAFRS